MCPRTATDDSATKTGTASSKTRGIAGLNIDIIVP
jgi:hypothetical protein